MQRNKPHASRLLTKDKNIRKLAGRRVELGLNQQELGEVLGTNACQISSWETGRNSPTYRNFSDWAQALSMKVEVTENED